MFIGLSQDTAIVQEHIYVIKSGWGAGKTDVYSLTNNADQRGHSRDVGVSIDDEWRAVLLVCSL